MARIGLTHVSLILKSFEFLKYSFVWTYARLFFSKKLWWRYKIAKNDDIKFQLFF